MARQRKEVEQVEQSEQANANERAAVAFLAESLGAFLSRPDLVKMTVQNDYGAISVSRELPEREQVHAIGFAADYDDYDEDDGDEYEDDDEGDGEESKAAYDEFVKNFVRWF